MEVLDAFKARHGLDEITVTAGAAMLLSANITALEDIGYHYIIGSRIAKTPYAITEYAKLPGQELEDNQIFDTLMEMNTGKGEKRKRSSTPATSSSKSSAPSAWPNPTSRPVPSSITPGIRSRRA